MIELVKEDKMSLTDRNFTLKEAKLSYIKNGTTESYQNFIEELKKNKVMMAYTWNLTEEDEKQLENSESGDTLYIETPMLPLLFKEDEGLGIPIFTCETEISAEYRNEYALQKCDLDYVLKLAKAIKKVTKQDVILDIDPLNDECVEINVKEFEK